MAARLPWHFGLGLWMAARSVASVYIRGGWLGGERWLIGSYTYNGWLGLPPPNPDATGADASFDQRDQPVSRTGIVPGRRPDRVRPRRHPFLVTGRCLSPGLGLMIDRPRAWWIGGPRRTWHPSHDGSAWPAITIQFLATVRVRFVCPPPIHPMPRCQVRLTWDSSTGTLSRCRWSGFGSCTGIEITFRPPEDLVCRHDGSRNLPVCYVGHSGWSTKRNQTQHTDMVRS
jgi:hypothetical protein